MMTYYYKYMHDVPEIGASKRMLVKHAIIGVTDDDKKDANGVKSFEDEAIKMIKKDVDLKTLHEWDDGCAAQYKGKNSFYDISMRKNVKVCRNYFETSEGKSVCDGLGAVVKSSCYQAVVSGREVIGDAKALFAYCTK